MTGDITRTTVESLALLRGQPASAYKLAAVASIRPQRAAKILAVAAELGLVVQCGQTYKRYPIYRWAELPERCHFCGALVDRR